VVDKVHSKSLVGASDLSDIIRDSRDNLVPYKN